MHKGRSQLIAWALLLLFWQAVSASGLWPSYLFPSPADVLQALWRLALNGSLVQAALHTLGRMALSFLVAAVGGGLVGLALTRERWLAELVGSAIHGLQAMPSICWYPLAILWFGLNEKALLFVTIAGALFAIASATEAGIRNIPPAYLRAASTMGARGWRLYLRVIFPASLPSLVTGLRLGWSFAWRSLMAAELLFMNHGLGHLLGIGRELADAAQVMAVILVILAAGILVDRACFARAERALRIRWGYEAAA